MNSCLKTVSFLVDLQGNAVLTLFFYVNLILYLFSGNYTIIGYRERWILTGYVVTFKASKHKKHKKTQTRKENLSEIQHAQDRNLISKLYEHHSPINYGKKVFKLYGQSLGDSP